MSDRKISPIHRAAWGAVVALVLLAASPAAAAPDPWITTKAKLALLADQTVSGSAINVDTIDGRVTLYGKVATEAEKAAAERSVRAIEGVKDVRNMLTIAPRESIAKGTQSDAQIEEAVKAALANDHALTGSNIRVSSVDEGIVKLDGIAATMTANVRALQTTLRVPGVVAVRSDIESPEVLTDAEMFGGGAKRVAASDPSKTTTASPSSASIQAQDMWITTATKLRLIGNDATPAMDINVDTTDAEVTLFGIVPSEAARTAAEKEATAVDGVRRVRNELQVVPARDTEQVQAADDQLEDAIEQRIESVKDLNDDDIEVEVNNGVARLTGSVGTGADRLVALTCARGVPGIRSAIDELRVRPS